jgi:uncharacterized protein YoxC
MMVSEVCLIVIAFMSVVVAIVLLKIAFQVHRCLQYLQADLHNLSVEVTDLAKTVSDFIRSDLHPISEETNQLIKKLNDISSDINNKPNSLGLLLKPLEFIKNKLGFGSSSEESSSMHKTVPRLLKWILSTAFLFKTTREFIKKHEQRTS